MQLQKQKLEVTRHSKNQHEQRFRIFVSTRLNGNQTRNSNTLSWHLKMLNEIPVFINRSILNEYRSILNIEYRSILNEVTALMNTAFRNTQTHSCVEYF